MCVGCRVASTRHVECLGISVEGKPSRIYIQSKVSGDLISTIARFQTTGLRFAPAIRLHIGVGLSRVSSRIGNQACICYQQPGRQFQGSLPDFKSPFHLIDLRYPADNGKGEEYNNNTPWNSSRAEECATLHVAPACTSSRIVSRSRSDTQYRCKVLPFPFTIDVCRETISILHIL